MMNVHIICVGKLKETFYTQAAAEYQKRLSPFCKLQLTELPEEKLPQVIRSKLPPNAAVVALCIEGKLHSSEALADLLRTWENNPAKHLVFLIGSSHGLDQSLKAEAWVRLSMSPMTFPHHLARVMLLDQVYRAFQINNGSKYHK